MKAAASCVYTAQGEMVCGTKKGAAIERFVAEKQNMGEGAKADPIVGVALANSYCDISVSIDPKTGGTQYALKKECEGLTR